MNLTEEFLFYKPYFVSNRIEEYFKMTPGVELKNISIIDKSMDYTVLPPPEESVLLSSVVHIADYSMIYHYKWTIEDKEYFFDVHIKESHKNDKYAPVNSSGYFMSECKFEIDTSCIHMKNIDTVYLHIKYLFDTLKMREMLEQDGRFMTINTNLSYSENSLPSSGTERELRR